MELLIDTTEREVIKLALLRGKKVIAKKIKKTAKMSEYVLPEIKKFLAGRKIDLHDLETILVNSGPGGFSSTRTGVATANALAYALEIPIAEWPSGKVREIVLPKYDKAPNITKPRKQSL